jgi:hypothetical protein
MTTKRLDDDLVEKEKEDPDYLFFSDANKATVKADLVRAKTMVDVVVRRLQIVASTTPSGGLLVTPRNKSYYDTKFKILNVFRINTLTADDVPIPQPILLALQQSFRGLKAPKPSSSPDDSINFATLMANFTQLRSSLDQPFIKEFYTQGTFKGQSLGFYSAFVDATNSNDSTVRFTRSYFNAMIVPSRDDRAVTVVHERAHTILRANGHPGTGDNPFCVAPHLGDPNVQTAAQALMNPYCYEWLIDALQPDYNPGRFRGPECGT